MLNKLIDWLINHAKKTPYFHLEGYMERYWLIKPSRWLPFSIRLHHILRSDDDRHLHDHPWSYCTIILRGGYTEIRERSQRWYGPGSVLFRGWKGFHRLVVPDGQTTWTLFMMGPYKHRWGFKVPYNEYLGEEQVQEQEKNYEKFYPGRREVHSSTTV